MVTWADPDVVDQAAQRWTDEQIACRLNRHYWGDRRMTLLSRHANGLLTIEQRCGRGCGVSRQANMNERTGYLVGAGWQTKYPKPSDDALPGYLLKDSSGKGVGRVDESGRARLRLASIVGLPITDVDDDA